MFKAKKIPLQTNSWILTFFVCCEIFGVRHGCGPLSLQSRYTLHYVIRKICIHYSFQPFLSSIRHIQSSLLIQLLKGESTLMSSAK